MCAEASGGILDFCSISRFYSGVLGRFLPSGWEGLEWLVFGIAGLTLAMIVINGVMAATAYYTWFERRTIGRFQSRLGPNRWGPFGLFQPLADGVKFLTKEDTRPATADLPGRETREKVKVEAPLQGKKGGLNLPSLKLLASGHPDPCWNSLQPREVCSTASDWFGVGSRNSRTRVISRK